ncbi:MAG: 3-deoxy-D-manno-octulosonic acid transferase [Syntrophales bacterium]|jgi:3-deoxy-D-manno-octulosonic-acid transferase|nr:3-deoxy-D-manno-octulosonic acid transferase [Syntrophales bacterium]MCK9391894.1 3-deoxy-D-manno-octulosonic acid transferase [Syntrophales bacterium]
MIFFLYNIALFIAACLALPYYVLKMALTGKYRRSLGAKFGMMAEELFFAMQGAPRIWIHAVSVGEVTAAAPIVAALRAELPEACIVLSTSTETGQDMARSLATEATAIIYYPLDIPFVVRKVITRVNPDVFVMTETELWPNFLHTCKEMKIKVIMVNGRISPRSFRRYRLSRFFWKRVLAFVDRVGVISDVDGERILSLGLSPERLEIMGNAKYDGLAAKVSPALQEEIALRLNIAPEDPVLVAGSTHEGEESVVLDVYRRLLPDYPAMKLILIPRHVERGAAVREIVARSGFADIITLSAINGGQGRAEERIIIVDVIGELFKIYSLATVVFCGGSLVPRGGQNILEPAAWGKVVFHGPSMEDFLSEKNILAGIGAGITVTNGEELLAGVRRMLSQPSLLKEKGEEARKAIIANRGAAKRYAGLIIESLRNQRG